MADTDEWIKCPECSKRVKAKNLGRHLLRVHEKSKEEIDQLKQEMSSAGESKSRKGAPGKASNAKLAAAVAFLVVIILITAAVYFLWIDTDDDSGPAGNENGPPPDPTLRKFTTSDGFELVGNFYNAKEGVVNTSTSNRPVLILVHGMNEKRGVWNSYGVVDDALDLGYNVLTYDIRGFGESIYKSGKRYDVDSFTEDDLNNMPQDVRAAVKYVRNNIYYNGRIIVAGASIGANSALSAAVYENDVRGVALLSPGLNYGGVTSFQEIYDYRQRPIFMAAGELEGIVDDCRTLYDQALTYNPDRTDITFKIYPAVDHHGTNLFKVEQFESDLLSWLEQVGY
jgi:alpha-beta hydrolase superfamily lysophospholipase